MELQLNLSDQEKSIFLTEFETHIGNMEDCLVNLEQGEEVKNNIEGFFRSIHTIKGNAGMANFIILQNFSHKIEDIFQTFRKNPNSFNENIIDYLFTAIDYIKVLKEIIDNPEIDLTEETLDDHIEAMNGALDTTTSSTKVDTSTTTKQKERIQHLDGSHISVLVKEDSSFPAVRLIQVTNLLNDSNITFITKPTFEEIKEDNITNPMIISIDKEDKSKVDELIKKISLIDDIEKVELQPEKKAPTPKKTSVEKTIAQDTKQELQDISVNIKKLDGLINLLGEILIDRNKIFQTAMELEEKYSLDSQTNELLDLINHMGKITFHLQKELLNIRTIPLSNILEKYPRLIREIAKNMNKKVRVEIKGQHVELDRLILNNLNDVFIHLIRNAIDHGVDSVEERKMLGKEERGTISIEAVQRDNKANFVISDDGRGISRKRIKEIIIERNIINQSTLDTLSDDEVIQFVFHPGFSTKKEVSSLSGRGVGMDVVQTTIQKLGGHITVESIEEKGTTFKISIPLTLAILHGLVTISENKTFIFPINYVDEIIRTKGQDLKEIKKEPHLLLRDTLIPIISLNSLITKKPMAVRQQKKLFIVVVNYNDRKTGIVVDKLLGEEEVVIKNVDHVEEYFKFIHSATIMGTGDIGLILDISILLEEAKKLVSEKKHTYENTYS
jgi:two-component system, chemotaxis family, sensor kinase CheA